MPRKDPAARAEYQKEYGPKQYARRWEHRRNEHLIRKFNITIEQYLGRWA